MKARTLAQRCILLWARRRRAAAAEGQAARLLVTCTRGLGDAVLARSILAHLQRANPDLKLGVLGSRLGLEVMRTLPLAAEHRIEPAQQSLRGRLRLIGEINKQGYTAAIATEHTSVMVAALLEACGIPRRIGFEPLCDCPQARYFTHAIRLDERRTHWQMLWELAKAYDVNLTLPAAPAPIRIPEAARSRVNTWWQATMPDGAAAILLHPGCGTVHDFKRWPVARFIELAERLRERDRATVFLLTATPPEAPLAGEFARGFSGRSVACPAFTIEELAAVCERVQVVVSGDTGIMHLAAAQGTPTVGLFGPTAPEQWAPWGPRAILVRQSGLPCAPCIRNFRGLTPGECAHPVKSACMLSIQVEEVVQAIRRVTGESFTQTSG